MHTPTQKFQYIFCLGKSYLENTSQPDASLEGTAKVSYSMAQNHIVKWTLSTPTFCI